MVKSQSVAPVPTMQDCMFVVQRHLEGRFPGHNVKVERDPLRDALRVEVVRHGMQPVVTHIATDYVLSRYRVPDVAMFQRHAEHAAKEIERFMATAQYRPASQYHYTTSIAATNSINYTTTVTPTSAVCYVDDSGQILSDDTSVQWVDPSKILVGKEAREVALPDGTKILLDEHGNFSVVDKDAKVTYRANRSRAFNPFVNAGDLLADFIKYLKQKVPRIGSKDVAELPLNLFVQWLVMEAAERDGDPVPPDVVPVPKDRLLISRLAPQCRLPTCRRFISKASAEVGFFYCNPNHAAEHGRLLRPA